MLRPGHDCVSRVRMMKAKDDKIRNDSDALDVMMFCAGDAIFFNSNRRPKMTCMLYRTSVSVSDTIIIASQFRSNLNGPASRTRSEV